MLMRLVVNVMFAAIHLRKPNAVFLSVYLVKLKSMLTKICFKFHNIAMRYGKYSMVYYIRIFSIYVGFYEANFIFIFPSCTFFFCKKSQVIIERRQK